MRKFLFRAWRKDIKVMEDVREMVWDNNGLKKQTGEQILNIVGFREFESYTGSGDLKNVVIMQFTGLFDKNGKEIYEGDIVTSAGTELIFQVVYKGSSFCRKWIDSVSKKYRYPVEPMAWNTHITCEVIGNIYQNPELLEHLDK